MGSRLQYIGIIIAVVLIGMGFFLANKGKDNQDVVVDMDSSYSYYDTFKIEDGKVYMYSTLTLENKTGKDVSFKIWAESAKDQSNGLIKDKKMVGYSYEVEEGKEEYKVSDKDTFFLEKDQRMEFCKIVFVGEHGNNNEKADRNLPKIMIEVNKADN